MENGKNNTLTQNDILEGIRTLNAIYSAMMIGSQVAIEKFIAKKKLPHHARKFFISEMVRSLDQIPDIRQQLEQAQKIRQVGGLSFPKIPTRFNPFNKNVNGAPVSASTTPGSSAPPALLQSQPMSTPLPLDATQSIPVAEPIIPIAEPIDAESVNNNNQDDDALPETQQQMESQAIDAMISSQMMMGKTIFKKIVQVSSNIVERIIDYTTGGILNKPPAELAGETNKIILVLSMVLKDLSTDEKQIQAMKDISEALTKTFLDVMDVIAPTIKQIVGKTFDNISSIGMQGASGSMRVFISMSKAAISEIPIVGGIINLILAFGESFNVFSKILSTLMTRGSHMSNDVVSAFMQARAKFEESFAKHKQDINKVRATINTLSNPTQSIGKTIEQIVPGIVPTLNPSIADQSDAPFAPVNIPRTGIIDKRTREEKAIHSANQKATTELENATIKQNVVDKSNAELESRRQLLKVQQAANEKRKDAYRTRIESNKPNILSRSLYNVKENWQERKDEKAQTQLQKNISKLEQNLRNEQQNAGIAQENANKAQQRASTLNQSFSQKQEAERAKKEAEDTLMNSNMKLKEAEDNLRKEVGPTRFEKFKGVFTRSKPQRGGKYKHKTKKLIKKNKYTKSNSKYKSKNKINITKRKMKRNKYFKNKLSKTRRK